MHMSRNFTLEISDNLKFWEWIIPLTLYLFHTALLPPHMKPAANRQSPPYSQPLPSSNTNNQIFTYDLPKDQPDLNAQPWDPNYSYSIPEGTGGEVNLPAVTSSVPGQTSGKPTRQLSHFVLKSNLIQHSECHIWRSLEQINFFRSQLSPQPHLSQQDLHSWGQYQSIWCCYLQPTQLLHPLRNYLQPRHLPHQLPVKMNIMSICYQMTQREDNFYNYSNH